MLVDTCLKCVITSNKIPQSEEMSLIYCFGTNACTNVHFLKSFLVDDHVCPNMLIYIVEQIPTSKQRHIQTHKGPLFLLYLVWHSLYMCDVYTQRWSEEWTLHVYQMQTCWEFTWQKHSRLPQGAVQPGGGNQGENGVGGTGLYSTLLTKD